MLVKVRKAFVTFDGKKMVIGKARESVDISPTLAQSLSRQGYVLLDGQEIKEAVIDAPVKKAAKTRKKKDED